MEGAAVAVRCSRGAVAVVAITVCTTYGIAVAHGDVRTAFMPMISYTFRVAPESYISRWGIVTGATLLQLTVWFTHSYLRTFAAPTAAWRWFTLAHTLVGSASAVASGILGSVSDKENFYAHITAAIAFFFGNLAWQVGPSS